MKKRNLISDVLIILMLISSLFLFATKDYSEATWFLGIAVFLRVNEEE